jgi:choline dehydrogenase-like flavoprotein
MRVVRGRDAAIAMGAGIAGLIAALALGRHGRRVVVLERDVAAAAEARAGRLTSGRAPGSGIFAGRTIFSVPAAACFATARPTCARLLVVGAREIDQAALLSGRGSPRTTISAWSPADVPYSKPFCTRRRPPSQPPDRRSGSRPQVNDRAPDHCRAHLNAASTAPGPLRRTPS